MKVPEFPHLDFGIELTEQQKKDLEALLKTKLSQRGITFIVDETFGKRRVISRDGGANWVVVEQGRDSGWKYRLKYSRWGRWAFTLDGHPRISISFKWYDFWIGGFYDRSKRILYICLLPMLPIRIKL